MLSHVGGWRQRAGRRFEGYSLQIAAKSWSSNLFGLSRPLLYRDSVPEVQKLFHKTPKIWVGSFFFGFPATHQKRENDSERCRGALSSPWQDMTEAATSFQP